MKKISFLIFYFIFCNIFILNILSAAGVKSKIDSKESKLQIAVSIAPLAFFVEKIAADKADAKIIVPNNKNAEFFEPDFKMIKTLENADMLVFIGMPFEKIYLEKMIKIKQDSKNAKKTEILRLDSIIPLERIKIHSKIKSLESNLQNKKEKELTQGLLQGKAVIQPSADSKENHHKHKENHDSHNEISHLWLSLNNAKIIAKEIAQNLISLDSKNANFYKENLAKLEQDIESSQGKIKEILKNMERRDFIVYHPLFEGFESEYNLIEHSLEKHGKKYGLQDILALSNFAKKIGVKRIFTQSENKDIKTLATSINAELVLINPMSKDYLKNLESIMEKIAKSYE
ncbi:zinc ABC transporter solute-binding protein [Helicobacter saguini]|nr:zinc ABC transporter substrate-binding protein [Helicobacter saguini]MWV61591.1 zinc ABC transporter solute-binding protein [Helicobacter saguini]MWV67738.1 zinc ABC transporter solute-binding protein [Helicobacter saguini]MWV70794.1 zinc ABC transporter solute-binding protein [Helicobacter saguini]MWV72698.1 zinc ABC transporter solute-binding protein [Helicobacter saguini]